MVKRTRIGSASILVDANVTNYVKTMTPPINDVNPWVIEQSSGVVNKHLNCVVFCLEPPESLDVVHCGSDRIGVFLEQCFYCKRMLLFNMPVYMYSEHAFCTIDCRGIQIMMDEAKEKLTGKRKVLD